MAYRNECQFLRGIEDDGNPANAPDITDTDNSGAAGGVSQTPSSTGLTSQQSWPQHGGQDQNTASLPTRERGGGGGAGGGTSPYPHMHGLMPLGGGGYEMDTSSTGLSGTSPEGQSNRPTPNSGSSADQRGQNSNNNNSNSNNSNNLAPGSAGGLHRNSSSGRTSFEASPAASSLPRGAAAAAATQGDINAASATAPSFFGDLPHSGSDGFGLGGTGLTPRFTMADAAGGANEFAGWEMPGQTGMTPVAEGVLRSIMNMGPMDTMDLAWDTETSMR